jgi:prepilin-type N-terminal cleavage/methylation domain-containing protein
MRKRKDHGFTILEIIAVIAIMAILAGISIPQYQRMVNKGRQQGAIAGLTSVFMAEKNFAAENRSYTTCLGSIGVRVAASQKKYYAFGFNGAGIQNSCGLAGSNLKCNVDAWDNGAIVSSCATNTADVDYVGANVNNYCPSNVCSAPANGLNLATQPSDITNSTFLARASGGVGAGSNWDRWTIDQTGTPINTQSGI